jgi:hypothetical protein
LRRVLDAAECRRPECGHAGRRPDNLRLGDAGGLGGGARRRLPILQAAKQLIAPNGIVVVIDPDQALPCRRIVRCHAGGRFVVARIDDTVDPQHIPAGHPAIAQRYSGLDGDAVARRFADRHAEDGCIVEPPLVEFDRRRGGEAAERRVIGCAGIRHRERHRPVGWQRIECRPVLVPG